MEIFVKELNGGKPLIMNTKGTSYVWQGAYWTVYIFAYIPIQYEIPGP